MTAEFNKNLLVRMNRELDADFDLKAFEHLAVYNPEMGRIESHLISQRPQTVEIDSHSIHFDAREGICTEHSHKFQLSEFARLAHAAGFEVAKVWTDDDGLFSVQYLAAR